MGFSAFFVVFIPFTGDAFKKTNSFLKKITFRGWLVIVFSILGSWAAIEKDQLAEDKNNLDRIAAKNDQANRDAIAEQRRMESNKEIANTFSNSLGKWGYKLDSQNNEIVRIFKDSAQKEEEPYIEIYKNGIPGLRYDRMDSLYFFLTINNPKPSTTAYNIHLSVEFFTKKNGNYILGNKTPDVFPTHPSISPHTQVHKIESFKITGFGDYKIDTIFVKADMTCTNYSKKIFRKTNEFDIIILSQKIWAEYDYNTDPTLYAYLRALKMYK